MSSDALMPDMSKMAPRIDGNKDGWIANQICLKCGYVTESRFFPRLKDVSYETETCPNCEEVASHPPQPKTGEPAMTHNPKGDAVFWFVIIAGMMALLVVASGCASQPRYEAAVQVESSGDQPVVVASFKLVN